MEPTLRMGNRTVYEWLAALPAFLILVFVVVLNTSSALHSQLLHLGEGVWAGYFELRFDPAEPRCNKYVDIDSEINRLMLEAESAVVDEWDLLAPEPVSESVLRQSLESSQQQCAVRYVKYEDASSRITPGVRMFRAVELGVASFGEFGIVAQRILLALLVLICGLTALFRRHHIALRPMQTALDHRVAATAQAVANSLLFYSLYSFKQVTFSSGLEVSTQHAVLHNLWVIGFAALLALSLYQIIFIPKDAQPGGNIFKAGLSVPLYAHMCMISGGYFILTGHSAGIGIYLNQMMELSQLFLNVGLYVWIGMLLKRTELIEKVFNVFRPFKLTPEVLSVVVVALAAIPTAYTGASGIFVIAVGGLIYNELRRAGARRQLALASTAMSGSLGVVLRPCLLVVIVAALNNEVTTVQLFGWGSKVFFLTMALFAGMALLTSQSKHNLNVPEGVFPEFLKGLKPLIPYVIIITLILLAYGYLLDAYLDERSEEHTSELQS